MRDPRNEEPASSPARRLYWSAVALCVIFRGLALVGTNPDGVMSRWSTATDAAVYDRFGWNLAHRGVLGFEDRPSAFALPAYPLLVAGVYRVAGHRPTAVRVVQGVLGVLTVVALGRLAGCLGGRRSELAAVLGGAVYPYFLYFTREILTETLFLFAFSAMLLSAVRLGRTGRLRDGVFHGASVALALLTRPTGLALEPAALLLARPWAREHRARRLAALLLGLIVLAGAWGSWIARNRAVFGETVLLDTHVGFARLVGQLVSRGLSAEEVVREVGYRHRDIEMNRLPGGPRGELEADRRSGEKARRLIREDPAGFLRTIPRNAAVLWLGLNFSDVGREGGGTVLLALVGWACYGPLLLLGIAGLLRLFRSGRRVEGVSVLLLLAATTFLHALVLGGQRYRVGTIDPVLLVLAAWEASVWFRTWREKRRGAPATPPGGGDGV
jgi:4-amino-4-deoxy-L-arabinose transferase-like glycosyltransferase